MFAEALSLYQKAIELEADFALAQQALDRLTAKQGNS
jgi:hypothetical protein